MKWGVIQTIRQLPSDTVESLLKLDDDNMFFQSNMTHSILWLQSHKCLEVLSRKPQDQVMCI